MLNVLKCIYLFNTVIFSKINSIDYVTISYDILNDFNCWIQLKARPLWWDGFDSEWTSKSKNLIFYYTQN